MAEIYRAVATTADGSEQQVAIKRLLPAYTADEQFVLMLVDEARITAMLEHRNIARIYEFGVVDDEYFLAMEFIEGVDLRSAILRCRERDLALPPDIAAFTVEQALRGLHAAHVQHDDGGAPMEIIHRDFSPSNILVSYDGQVKLIDFGIAKAKMSRTITRHGVIKGKVKYMSPEQTLGKRLDRRSDVFAAGAVLYSAVTSHAPFHAPDDTSLMLAVREQQPDPPSQSADGVDEAFDALVHRALQKHPADRYPDAQAFAEALAAWRERKYPDFDYRRVARFLERIFAREKRESEELFGEYDLTYVGTDEDTGADRQYTRLVDVGHFTGSREVADPVADVDRWLELRRRKTDGGATEPPRAGDEPFWSPDSRPVWVDETRRTLEMEAIKFGTSPGIDDDETGTSELEVDVDTGVYERGEETTNPRVS